MKAAPDTWTTCSLGDGMWAPVVAAEIEARFLPLFTLAGKPADMAVFTRREDGGLHCEVVAYFAPAARAVADAFEAKPCARPSRTGLELLAGDERCWPALFPEPEN